MKLYTLYGRKKHLQFTSPSEVDFRDQQQMTFTVFYSWQTDCDSKTNRNFILDALERAARKLGRDQATVVEVDRDTAGVGGSPDIGQTIFAKITQSDVFVCDVSIINSGADGRLTPNPNVLVELGYALSSLGSERIIMILNTATGLPDELPFDLRSKRVTTYELNSGFTPEDRAPVREDLVNRLAAGIGHIVSELTATHQATTSVEREADRVQQTAEVRRWMNDCFTRFAEVANERLDGEDKVNDLPARFKHGVYELAYEILPNVTNRSLGSMLELMDSSQVSFTGWPVWWVVRQSDFPELKPKPLNGFVEQFVAKADDPNPSRSDFWRADPVGRLYLVRGYREDYSEEHVPGATTEIAQPIRNIAEALAHAGRMSNAMNLDADATIVFAARFSGLRGRSLGFPDEGRAGLYNYTIAQESFSNAIAIPAEEVESNLDAVVHDFLSPMYQAYNFYELHQHVVSHAVEQLFARTYRI